MWEVTLQEGLLLALLVSHLCGWVVYLYQRTARRDACDVSDKVEAQSAILSRIRNEVLKVQTAMKETPRVQTVSGTPWALFLAGLTIGAVVTMLFLHFF